MEKVNEVRGLKCPNHDYVRDNCHFLYEEAYPGARPLQSTIGELLVILHVWENNIP